MANIKFWWDNKWKAETLLVSSDATWFPSTNTQLSDWRKEWRSNYGAGSGGGYFVIRANINDRIDFDEGGGEITANLTPGSFNADSLFAHLKTIMDAAGAHTYTWSHLEAGSDINKFKCVDGTGNVAFPWKTGTNTARSVGDTIGFDVTADDGAAATHTADEIRIHYREYIYFTRASTINVYGAIIRGHNFQSGATVSLFGSDDDFGTTPLAASFTTQDDILILEYDAVQAYQDWMIRVVDVDNPDGYIAIGTIFLGPQFQPTLNFLNQPHMVGRQDPSIIKPSFDGQETSIQRSKYDEFNYEFRVKGSTQKGLFDTMFDAVGTSKKFFITEDPDSSLSTTKYVRLTGWQWSQIYSVTDYWNLSISLKTQP